MRKRRRRLVLSLAAVVVVVGLALLVRHELFGEKTLATIELPSGDRIKICYQSPRKLTTALAGVGGLRYHIYSGGSRRSGWLTTGLRYDLVSDVHLKYEILGDGSVKVSARNEPGWTFSGDLRGEYEIENLRRRGKGLQGSQSR